MKKKIFRQKRFGFTHRCTQKGFTLIELLIGGTIMLVVILAALTIYMQSNKITVDQQQFSELQHDVRASLFFIARDARASGTGLPIEFAGFYIEGMDNESQGDEVTSDRLKIMGNLEDPLNLRIDNYQGDSINVRLDDHSFEQYPYDDEFYEEKMVLILPNPDSGCLSGQIRTVTHVSHSATGSLERLNFSPGLAPDVNPPGGLSGTCSSSNDYDGGSVCFINVKEYWLDVTGNYPGLTAGDKGYIGNGEGGILYLTENGLHYPLARNIENLQFQFNGDFDDDEDGTLDGFTDWDNDSWTGDGALIGRISQIRMWVLGRTPNKFASVSGEPPQNIHHYRRPAIANTMAGSTDDLHRRFILESTSNVRNKTLNLYNFGKRK